HLSRSASGFFKRHPDAVKLALVATVVAVATGVFIAKKEAFPSSTPATATATPATATPATPATATPATPATATPATVTPATVTPATVTPTKAAETSHTLRTWKKTYAFIVVQ